MFFYAIGVSILLLNLELYKMEFLMNFLKGISLGQENYGSRQGSCHYILH